MLVSEQLLVYLHSNSKHFCCSSKELQIKYKERHLCKSFRCVIMLWLFDSGSCLSDIKVCGCLMLNGWHGAALTLGTACWHLHLSLWNDVTLSPGMCDCVYVWDNTCQTACGSADASLVSHGHSALSGSFWSVYPDSETLWEIISTWKAIGIHNSCSEYDTF